MLCVLCEYFLGSAVVVYNNVLSLQMKRSVNGVSA